MSAPSSAICRMSRETKPLVQREKTRIDGGGGGGGLFSPLPRRAPLELRHERHVIGRALGVGQSPVLVPALLLGGQLEQRERRQGIVGVEDVVQRPEESVGAVGEDGFPRALRVHARPLPVRRLALQARLLGQRRVRGHQRQRVLQLRGRSQDTERIRRELRVRPVDSAVAQQVMRGAPRHRVEITADHHGNLRARRDLLQALEQGVHLPELHVVELGVGVDVGVGHAEQLTLTLRRLDPGLLQRLEHDDERDVVLHQPVERILLLGRPTERLHQRERRLVELHLVLLDQGEPVLLEEDGAPVDDVRALAEHLRRLLLVNRGVPVLGELPGEKVLEVVALHLL
mmetsp:Transcript_6959/g.31436  ORF Transcript_6959/g.31436 Transcript_6959/m.31436 type:complete len:343 (+) Transcript_6959:95-1123(+)